MSNKILVVCEVENGRLAPVTFEMVAVAKAVAAKTGQAVVAGLAGPPGATALSKELFSRGIPEVYVAEHAALTNGGLEALSLAVEAVCLKAGVDLVIVGQSQTGRDLAPSLAQRLGAGVVMNCIQLQGPEPGKLEAVCPVFGGVAHSVYQFVGARPKVVGFQPRLLQPEPAGTASNENVISVDAGLGAFVPKTKVVSRSVATGARLEDAHVIVAGGLGLGDKSNYKRIEELASAMKGLPAASRAIVDRGWATSAQQVGLTGKVVAPELYMAFGISGASQHMAGCSASRAIVAVNTDKDAAIFRYAKYGVVADCLEFLPAFLEEYRSLGKA